MSRANKLYAFVLLVVALAATMLVVVFPHGGPHPNVFELTAFLVLAFLLDQTGNPLRVEAAGSTSFIIHMAAGLLWGPFWGAVVAGVSSLATHVVRNRPPIKILFNICQRTLCVSVGLIVYQALGGELPPSYLVPSIVATGQAIQRDIGSFFAFSATYFALNTVLVNTAVSLSSGRPFREVWNVNSRGVLAYDIGGSSLAIALAWLYSKSEQAWGVGVIGFLAVAGPILAIRHVYGLYRKLQNTGRELLDLMVKAIEARDPYTSGHSVRVATVSKAIAHELKMPMEQVDEVYTAALLHDVGKIHEEFAPLLRKDTKLTPEETALLQTHPVKSAELVGMISSFRGKVQGSVRHHHERWDGGGYPDGLAGEQIPIGARIIMMADTADAMLTDRPYRRRLSIDAVMAEFQKYRGTQFDPALVDLVVNSVTLRRVITNLQSGGDGQGTESSREGGSRKATGSSRGFFGSRSSWPKAGAFY
jgi:putative nucleotidyltransferase with HDIG domain